MSVRVLLIALLIASCGGARAAEPSPPPRADAAVIASIPDGPVVYEPEQLIFPPEEFPLKADVARDAPVAVHGWEREFLTKGSADFRWFTVRLFVLDPDVPGSRFVADNGCGAVTWPDEQAVGFEVASGDTATRACRYEFKDGSRVLYHASGFRNVGILVGAQPRRDEVTDKIAVEWLAALSAQQIAIVGRVLATAR
ncbi:MAG: hypothetical protein HYX56_02915 [Chloroflexi bacterium]|nr:hypothetical protein [Chloroflexota bacterium]